LTNFAQGMLNLFLSYLNPLGHRSRLAAGSSARALEAVGHKYRVTKYEHQSPVFTGVAAETGTAMQV